MIFAGMIAEDGRGATLVVALSKKDIERLEDGQAGFLGDIHNAVRVVAKQDHVQALALMAESQEEITEALQNLAPNAQIHELNPDNWELEE